MAKKTIWQVFQTLDRRFLYLFLIVATSIPVILDHVVIPTQCKEPSITFYQELMKIPEGGTVLLQSDWTNSTRGENAAQLEAVLRIIHKRKLKFVLYSLTDAQSPRVARDVIFAMNEEFSKKNEHILMPWRDWVDLEYFPDPNSFLLTLFLDYKKAVQGEVNDDSSGIPRPVLDSPVLRNIKRVEDFGMLISISGTGILRTIIERAQQPSKVKLAAMITGVMGPETLNYYTAKQIVGVIIGLRGTVELETLMSKGINWPERGEKIAVSNTGGNITPPLDSKPSFARGMSYYLALHVALSVLILGIIVNNIALLIQRRKKA
jgi:hypothetical protein